MTAHRRKVAHTDETVQSPPADATTGGAVVRSQEAYVAFAFAAADLLLETDTDGRIIFAIGASMALVGRPARLLANSPLSALVRTKDRPRLAQALRRMGDGNRVRHVLLSVEFPDGETVPVALSGYPHPDRQGRLLCVLTHSGGLATPARTRRDGELLDKASFKALAQDVMQDTAAGGDEHYKLTLLDLPELKALRERFGTVKTAGFIKGFAEYLRNASLSGDSAAELGDNKYGIIHGPDITARDIETTVADLAASLVGHDHRLRPTATSLALDTHGLSPAEASRALAYTINAFTAEDDRAIGELADAARPRLSVTVAQMREVKETIEAGRFDLHVQPIVDLWTNAVHHFECLVRFAGGGGSPYSTVTFAESVGLAAQLDYAVLERAISFMRSPLGGQEGLKFAVNVSGRTLARAATAARLIELVQGARDLRGRLLFEITESAEIPDLEAANAVIQELRAYGHPVGLDDFGAGSAAFHYLRALTVDHVKIDGSYVKDLAGSGNHLPFLRAITQLCRELRIATIAEHVESEESANLLRVYNVRYGQGYHFGKPHLPKARTRDPASAWITPKIHWRNGLLFFGNPAKAPGPADDVS
ncbi:MAG: EAL domain-containing protein [Actinomycetota bacterium]